MFRNAQTLMVQGTTSDAGKSILVTALCRILARQGISVAPFKPQNMALNSAVTADGGEIGRAQAVQAEACYLAPSVDMNPVLLKPTSDVGSQIIVRGHAVTNMTAQEYHAYKPELLKDVLASYQRLQTQHQVIVVEGAGSPAEINLREHDIANMGFAEAADCPVIIVADIDRGGVFAHLFGTYALLSESEKQRVVGFVINRFRGDVSLLQSGLDWLKQKTSVPVLAVIPYLKDLHIEAEDSVSASKQMQPFSGSQKLRVVVVMYPRASNQTDFDVLRIHPEIDCQLISDVNDFTGADLIILPGSKSVRGDLQWLSDHAWMPVIHRHLRLNGKLIGICGGYQMLGRWVHDPEGVESHAGSSAGLGLLDIETCLTKNKTLKNVEGQCRLRVAQVQGYEIHTGQTTGKGLDAPLFTVSQANGDTVSYNDGVISADGQILGSYIHGLFDHPSMQAMLFSWVGLEATQSFDYHAFRDAEIQRLADAVEVALDKKVLLDLLSIDEQGDAVKALV